MAALPFTDARGRVIDRILREGSKPSVERVALADALGRVLAEPVAADRDYPPFHRSARDGFAVRAEDLPGPLDVCGEVPAGSIFEGTLGAGQAIEIMTGAPVPDAADCVVMVEHTTRDGSRVTVSGDYSAGANFTPRASECRSGDTLLNPGKRAGYPEIALMASVGVIRTAVYRRPRVAIISTGDEIVENSQTPLAYQIRNSNSHSLAAQVRLAGGDPEILPIARDSIESTTQAIQRALGYDLFLLSGGVSAGKYDVVEPALSRFEAEIEFDRVLIQPGQPLVFGHARGVPFFGLPGNPASTMVCFEIFARAAVELLAGQSEASLPLTLARLTEPFRHRPGLTRFLPASLAADGGRITPIKWSGSGDMAALARANCYLVADPAQAEYNAGDLIGVLLR